MSPCHSCSWYDDINTNIIILQSIIILSAFFSILIFVQEAEKFWPGLGLSEVFYSWTVCVYSIGEVVAAAIAGYMTKYIPYRYTILLAALTLAVGLLLYALTVQGWMIIVARLLIGVHTGFDLVLVTAYLGETGTEVAAKREAAGGKRDHDGATLKDKLFIWYSFVTNGSFLSGLSKQTLAYIF